MIEVHRYSLWDDIRRSPGFRSIQKPISNGNDMITKRKETQTKSLLETPLSYDKTEKVEINKDLNKSFDSMTPSPVLSLDQIFYQAGWNGDSFFPKTFDNLLFDSTNRETVAPIKLVFEQQDDHWNSGDDNKENMGEVPSSINEIYHLSNTTRNKKKKKLEVNEPSSPIFVHDGEKRVKVEDGSQSEDKMDDCIDFMIDIGWITKSDSQSYLSHFLSNDKRTDTKSNPNPGTQSYSRGTHGTKYLSKKKIDQTYRPKKHRQNQKNIHQKISRILISFTYAL